MRLPGKTISLVLAPRAVEIAKLCQGVIDARDRFKFMDVARALCLLAATKPLGSGSAALELAEKLQIRKQTLHNWVKRDLDAWMKRMESALAGVPEELKRRRQIITNDDAAWLCAEREKVRTESTRQFALRVKQKCRNRGERLHLLALSHTALSNRAGHIAQNASASASVTELR